MTKTVYSRVGSIIGVICAITLFFALKPGYGERVLLAPDGPIMLVATISLLILAPYFIAGMFGSLVYYILKHITLGMLPYWIKSGLLAVAVLTPLFIIVALLAWDEFFFIITPPFDMFFGFNFFYISLKIERFFQVNALNKELLDPMIIILYAIPFTVAVFVAGAVVGVVVRTTKIFRRLTRADKLDTLK